MTRKAFDRDLFNKNDEEARENTIQYLEWYGYNVVPHPNPYAQDLVATDRRNGKRFLVECEIKRLWKCESFPFDSVQLPERKRKFFDEKTLFFIWNDYGSTAITFWSDKISHLEPVEVKNKYVSEGELFFQIPLELTRQVKL